MNCSKVSFASLTNEMHKGLSHQHMTACENYGITWGCDIDCPVLRDGHCELQDSENKELYQNFLKETHGNN